MHLSKKEILQAVSAFRKKAQLSYSSGDLVKTLYWIDLCCIVGSQFNLLYEDPAIERLYLQIARDLNRPVDDFIPNPNRIVFYDEFCISYVLGIQWITALAKTGKEILYITTREIDDDSLRANILDRVREFENVQITVISEASAPSTGQALFKTITDFHPSQLVLQMRVNSPANLMLSALPKAIIRYNINLDDQTLWYGTQGIDYILEFRPFGASVSIQKRGFSPNKLLMVPFYPADDKNAFLGYPEECSSDKLVIFSGGDFYKTLDEKGQYWHLVKSILNRWDNVVFLFASKSIPEGDQVINDFIAQNGFERRFIHISFRPDIYQVFAHCDIYMGTCPTSGSLMSQLAAINKKPILQFYAAGTPDDETEQAICWNQQFRISFDNQNDFLAEAGRLIDDASYRKSQGEKLYDAILKPSQFNDIVRKTLETNQSQFSISEYEIDYDSLDDRWYFLEKGGFRHTMSYVYGLLGAWDCLKYAPSIFFKKNFNRFIINYSKRIWSWLCH